MTRSYAVCAEWIARRLHDAIQRQEELVSAQMEAEAEHRACERVIAERDALRAALQEIADGNVPGAFSRDPGEHAKNTLFATWEFAKAALAVQP